VEKLREELFNPFSTQLSRLYADLDILKRTALSDDSEVMRTLDDVRSRDDDKIVLLKSNLKDYESLITGFKQQITKEVSSYHSSIVVEVEKRLKEAADREDEKEAREQEMVEEVRSKVEKEFAEQFEHRFEALENQLKDKEKMA
jgi:uncharacterized protein YydD (DUF2326 family)